MLNHTPTRLTVDVQGSTVFAHGEIDALTSHQLKTALEPLLEVGDIGLDLADIGFMDSSGLRVIVDAHVKALDAGFRFELVNPGSRVRRLINVSGLDGAIRIAERDHSTNGLG
ncbi:MAG: STAS domain-containing protein [Ilumatobacter sp.]